MSASTTAARAMEVLTQEHRTILRVLACLDRIVDRAAREGRLDGDAAERTIAFVRTYADAWHHAKEEDLLFPLLTRRGLPSDSGPIAVMLREHQEGRAAVRALAEHAPGAAEGDAGELTAFVRHARGYVDLLRDHIAKEDNVLFPMTRAFLEDHAAEELERRFAEAESRFAPGTLESMLALADRLCREQGVDRDAVDAFLSRAHGGCGGDCGGHGSNEEGERA